ncbi:efflux transporter outer membrane subunit [Sphingomonas sp. 35-24ZXX]|uniref:efflux transporter outer membrane subunit n=1 Tax=Sphingomonas sp. 35-24ZXX TaxID=1545915 RepID=UPI00053BFDA3|nr:efflux transporter outer membrane subunit [Sphingomonas sp. 35-24ZXX]
MRHPLRLQSVTLAMLLLGGCAAAPDYAPPRMATPDTFLVSDAAAARAGTVAQIDLVEWWRSFDDPLLTSLVERAIAQNLDLQQAEARVLQARAALRSANAALAPSGTASAQAGANYQSLETPIGQVAGAFPGFDRSTGAYDAGLSASWEIDLFGGKDASRDAARADWQASEAGAVAARLAVIAQTADTYVAIRTLQERLRIVREQEAVQARLAGLIALQFQRGVAAELQWRQAEGALGQVRASIPAIESDLETAMNALDVLLGQQPRATRSELAGPVPVPAPPAITTAEGPAALLRRRPDIIAAERTLAASSARIGAATAEYYPKFSLNGLLGAAATGPGALFGGNAVQGSGFLGLRWRLFDFGRIDAEIKLAQGRNAEALAAYRQTVLRASEDVENAFSVMLRQEARAEALAAAETSLARARSSSQAAYKAGMVSLIEVLEADRRLLETRDGLAQARAGASRGAIAAFRALGGGWQGAGSRTDVETGK